MKFALIGQDIPALTPTLLTDLLFTGKQAAQVWIEEKNQAMQDVLERYGKAIIEKSGIDATLTAEGDRSQVLQGADCVIYAGDCMAASRFRQDREALSGSDENDPGLTEQARVNGGIEGLLHTLRQGETVMTLCEAMQEHCPHALVVNLGQPVARTTAIFEAMGFRCYGLGRTPLRGANGLDTLCKKLHVQPKDVQATIAGLPGFAFLLGLKQQGENLLPRLHQMARKEELGRLTGRWLDWYEALAIGDVTDHAEFLPAQEDFIPEEDPVFGESVEQRKERILHMNAVGSQGASQREGMMAQLLLLSKAPPIRPMQLALALLRGDSLTMDAVTRINNDELPQLAKCAVIEARLTLQQGQVCPHGTQLPPPLAEICGEIDETNRLAARAAMGDRSALRECIEIDPALSGLDRLYCQELVDKLIQLHDDVLNRL